MPRCDLAPSALTLAPYLDQYWRDCDRDGVYAAGFVAFHVDQAGEAVGQSWHVNGPSADFNDAFMSDLLFASDGEVA